MIRQVVFDMGDVLLDFHTREAAAAFTENEADAELLHREVFRSPWWIRLDRGGDEATSLRGMLACLPERLHPAARALMGRWEDWLIPDRETIALAEALGERGYGLYLLSNTSERFRQFRGKLPVLDRFRGVVVSYEEGVMKPDPAFYHRLFDRFSLRPQECFFVDDAPANIECARFLGMEGHCFRGDLPALRRDLLACGVDARP